MENVTAACLSKQATFLVTLKPHSSILRHSIFGQKRLSAFCSHDLKSDDIAEDAAKQVW
jgi:hypothetical protein